MNYYDYQQDFFLGYAHASGIEVPDDCNDVVEYLNGFYGAHLDSKERFDRKSKPCGKGWIPMDKECLIGKGRAVLGANATGKIPGMKQTKGPLRGKDIAAGLAAGGAIGGAALLMKRKKKPQKMLPAPRKALAGSDDFRNAVVDVEARSVQGAKAHGRKKAKEEGKAYNAAGKQLVDEARRAEPLSQKVKGIAREAGARTRNALETAKGFKNQMEEKGKGIMEKRKKKS